MNIMATEYWLKRKRDDENEAEAHDCKGVLKRKRDDEDQAEAPASKPKGNTTTKRQQTKDAVTTEV